MSRVAEFDVEDPIGDVAKRVRKAFSRIGSIQKFEPAQSLTGKISANGHTAVLTIHWTEKNGRVFVDITSRSKDELSQTADEALYRFLQAYKRVQPEDLDKPDPLIRIRRNVVTTIVLCLCGLLYLAILFYYLKRPH